MNAVDTNILIYSVDAHEHAKRQRALELLSSLPDDRTVTPWQIACEVGSVLRHLAAGKRVTGAYDEILVALRSRFRIALPTPGVLDRATRLEREAQMSYWDALLVAACAEAGVTRLYSEDLQGRPVIDSVEIVNPFR